MHVCLKIHAESPRRHFHLFAIAGGSYVTRVINRVPAESKACLSDSYIARRTNDLRCAQDYSDFCVTLRKLVSLFVRLDRAIFCSVSRRRKSRGNVLSNIIGAPRASCLDVLQPSPTFSIRRSSGVSSVLPTSSPTRTSVVLASYTARSNAQPHVFQPRARAHALAAVTNMFWAAWPSSLPLSATPRGAC